MRRGWRLRMPRLFSAPVKRSGPREMANKNAAWRQSMSQGCATPVESAIVLWYCFRADINTSAADEDDRDLLKV